MLYLTCTTISSVALALYGVSRAKDWVSVDGGTTLIKFYMAWRNVTLLEITFEQFSLSVLHIIATFNYYVRCMIF